MVSRVHLTILSLVEALLIMSHPPVHAASADARKLQTFPVRGLENAASGTVYPAGSLEQGGMPLGGLGTGYLCLDTDLRLGKCSIFNRLPAPIVLGKPFLTLTVGGKQLPLTAVEGGAVKAVHYFGHFPVADVRLELDVPIAVELRAYSPFILGDAVAGNTPAAVFEVSLTNTSSEPQTVALTFSPGGFPQGEAKAFAVDGWAGVQVTHRPIENLPGWVHHTYALAVEDGAAEADAAGARAVGRRDLKPGESTTLRFVLAWHQPYLREGSGRVEKHTYADRFPDAQAVATLAMGKRQEWLRRVLAWQDVIYGSDLPPWLQEELVNVPYTLAKNSVWLARTRPDDWWGPEGLFLVNESFSTCAITETMPCRFFGHWPALLFFPELERTTLGAIRRHQVRDGEPPFCLGLALAIRDPRYRCQHTCGAGEYPQLIHRFYLRTGDEQFLKDFWPSARDSLNFMLWLDRDGDGLVEDHPHAFRGEGFPGNNPLDCWPWYGASSYTAGKALAALVSGIRMAEIVGDREQAEKWRQALDRGRKAYEQKLWTGSYYRTYSGTPDHPRNDACFSAQLSSVWCTRVLGLEDPLPKDRIDKALDTIARLNIPASAYGTVDAVFPDGKVCTEARWANDIFIQCNATAAMVYLYLGRRAEGEKAARAMLDTIFRGPHAMPWSQPCGLSSATGGTCHGHDYYDHMVVWSYPLAFAGQDIPAACAPGGLVHRILAATGE